MLIKKFLIYFLIIFSLFVCVFSVTNSYWKKTFPYTHDGENHLARFASYKLAVREGHIPPRISPNLHNRYGYPVFNFNYPLANSISLPFSILKINYETIFSFQVIFATALGWIGIFYAMKLAKKTVTESLLLAGMYSSTPYLTMALTFRGSIGEIWAYSLLPWVWVSTFWIQNFHALFSKETHTNSKKITQNIQSFVIICIWTSFLLSHNVAIFLSISLVFIIAWVQFGTKAQYYLHAVYLGGISFLLSAWFWIPALLEKNQTVLSDATLSNQYFSHFLSFPTLLFSTHTFGYSIAGHSNTMAPHLGLPLVLLCLYLASILGIYFLEILQKYIFNSRFITKKVITTQVIASSFKNSRALPIFFMTVLIGFFTLQSSEFFVSHLPFIELIQFPWRWLLIFPLGIAVTYSMTNVPLPKTLSVLFAIAVVVQLTIAFHAITADSFHKSNETYDYYTMSTSTLNENLPKTFLYTRISEWEPSPQVLDSSGEKTDEAILAVLYWAGTKRTYQINTEQPITVVEPTMYFSGWETKVTDMSTDTTSRIIYTDSPDIGGRIAFTLEPGTYEVSSTFTQNTFPRILGNSLSILAIVFFIVQLGKLVSSLPFKLQKIKTSTTGSKK